MAGQKGSLKRKSLTSIDDISVPQIHEIFKLTPKMRKLCENRKFARTLEGQIIALLFFEPSSRTFSSFATAVKRLGAQTIEYQSLLTTSSAVKGETFSDTIRTFSNYANGLIIRFNEVGGPKLASEIAEVPVINAGDGAGEHPTQALLDFYTIWEKFGTLDNLKCVFAGDLLYGRTVHSLLRGLAKYKGNTAYLLSPKNLRLDRVLFSEIEKKGVKLLEIFDDKDLPSDANFWYWTRVQKERMENPKDFEKLRDKFILNKSLSDKYGGKDTQFMHPLPRVGEISEDLDSDERAAYFRQVRNGLFVRMALLSLIFG